MYTGFMWEKVCLNKVELFTITPIFTQLTDLSLIFLTTGAVSCFLLKP